MTKKNIVLVGIVLVLLGVYICFFTDWFKPRVIKIGDTMRPLRRLHARNNLPYILFILEGRYRLNDIKVVPRDDYLKSPMALPLWHLQSDDGSIPIKEFIYGEHIRGMDPAQDGDQPQPLDTNVVYRLIVTAGNAKGWHDFQIR